jgi:hypothetical protein
MLEGKGIRKNRSAKDLSCWLMSLLEIAVDLPIDTKYALNRSMHLLQRQFLLMMRSLGLIELA